MMSSYAPGAARRGGRRGDRRWGPGAIAALVVFALTPALIFFYLHTATDTLATTNSDLSKSSTAPQPAFTAGPLPAETQSQTTAPAVAPALPPKDADPNNALLAAALDRAVVRLAKSGYDAVVLEPGLMYEFSIEAIPQLQEAYEYFANHTPPWPDAEYKRLYDPSCDKFWDAAQQLPDYEFYDKHEQGWKVGGPPVCGPEEGKAGPPDAPHGRTWSSSLNKEGLTDLAKVLRRGIPMTIGTRGIHYYPPGSFREWHSNRYDPLGWRIYMIHTTDQRPSYFAWVSPDGKLSKRKDRDAVVRFFHIRGDNPLWHSIWSDTHRWSVGMVADAGELTKFVEESMGVEKKRGEEK